MEEFESTAKLQLETERSKTERLQLEIQDWEADVKRLETELNLLKAEKAQRVGQAAETEEGISALQVALSEAEHERQSLHHKYVQEKERCERAERECIELRAANHDLGIKISDMGLEVDELRTQAVSWKEAMQGQGVSFASLRDEMERLMRGNKELKDEIEIQQHEVEFAKQDFAAERRDREQAATRYEDEKARMNVENQQLTDRVGNCLRDIEMYKGEIDQLKGELAQLRDDVLVKTQQMKQYEKQEDEHRTQVEGLKAELSVYQQRTMQYRQQHENLQGECMRLQQQLQRQAEEARQRLQLLQQRLDAALVEVQRLQRSSQIVPQPRMSWNIPRQEVETSSEIGRGAWGTVYRGRIRGQSVAVKCVHPDILDGHTIDRLRREVQIMAQVRHPNLLRFIGAVLDSQVSRQSPPLIVLELLDMNLREAYQTRRLQGSSRISIFRDVAYALHYLHELHEPIIHRDVSAPNVLLEALPSGMWRAKVSDFGSANLARLAQTMGEGAIIYAAPETFPRELSSRPPPQTTKIDVYSYGVLLCEVITSQMPDRDRFWLMLQQVEKRWPLMHRLILSCIKQNADERPTMAEILDQLNALPRPRPN